jgi:D-threo-aldose 1-dehydrogenase
LQVTEVCMGGGGLGGVPQLFGYDVPVDRAVATVLRVFDGPLNFFDTSAIYSNGESERRIGLALREAGGLPDGFVLATKADRDADTGDFSGAQMRRSLEGSLERLGLDRVQLLYLHDPEHISFEAGTASGGPVEVLVELQREGLVGSLGVAGGPVGLMSQYLRTGVFDVLITHNRWSLVDRSADALLDEARDLGVAVVNGAPFGGGILARGSAATQLYGYRPASDETLRRIAAMEDACRRADVPLAAAALQFSTRDPRITSSIVGVSRPERIDETVELATMAIPPQLWDELEPLAAEEKEWLW